MSRQFEAAIIEQLAGIEEIDIETLSGANAVQRTTIWVVVDDGEAYIRSYRGDAGRWYQHVKLHPQAMVYVGEMSLPVIAIAVDSQVVNAGISAEYSRKYAHSPYAQSMIQDDIAATTLRLESPEE